MKKTAWKILAVINLFVGIAAVSVGFEVVGWIEIAFAVVVLLCKF
jgi:hypothetical protein